MMINVYDRASWLGRQLGTLRLQQTLETLEPVVRLIALEDVPPWEIPRTDIEETTDYQVVELRTERRGWMRHRWSILTTDAPIEVLRRVQGFMECS